METNISFIFFDIFFSKHNTLMMYKQHYLFEFKKANSEYFTTIREKEQEIGIEECSAEFKREIRQNFLKIETVEKNKSYLSLIQNELNSVYVYIENKPNYPELDFLEYHSSIPSIQNFINSILNKEEFQENDKQVNWNDLIETTMLKLIEAAEIKANPTLSAIRCAAFCEVLLDKGYIKKTKTRVKTLTEFAASRYEKDISKSLLTSKKVARESYKTHPKAGQLAINKCV